ncbi:MAG TPA: hypothetical protein VFP71_08250 [Candidatus Angelobacter sp.]|nr:hypothetical protein [Candidatus Angelobacter sp.]
MPPPVPLPSQLVMVLPSQTISVPHPSGAFGSLMQGLMHPANTGFSAQHAGDPGSETHGSTWQLPSLQLCGQLPDRLQNDPVELTQV